MKHLSAPRPASLSALTILTTCALLSTAPVEAQSRAYVANSGAQLVSVIDTDTNAVVTTIPIGSSPSGVAVAADGRRAYVTSSAADLVKVIDTASNTVVATIPVGDAPTRVAVSPDGQLAYVMLTAGGIDVVDTNLGTVVTTLPIAGNGGGGIAFTPDGARAYVASGMVSVVDVESSTIVASFLPETAPVQDVSHTAVSVALSPDGSRAYVARVTFNFGLAGFSAGGGVVTVDTATNTVIATANTGSLPGPIDITPDGSRLYVALQSTWVNVGTAQGFLPAKVVAAIDTTTNAIVGWIVVANRPADVAVTLDGTEAFVTIPTGSTVAVIATATNTVSTSLPVAASPGGIDTFDLPEPSVTLFCFGDGSGAPCPCANESAPGADEGCLNSLGLGGKLRASGVARISADTLVLEGSQMPDSTALYFQGTLQAGGGAGVVFGDGVRCAGGQLIRLGAKLNAGGASQFPVAGDPSISVRGEVTQPGTVRTYQAWYRNPVDFCSSEPSNFSNGVEVRWEL